MKVEGMPIDLIIKYTGLSPDEIAKIECLDTDIKKSKMATLKTTM
jgi:hypothetical protein